MRSTILIAIFSVACIGGCYAIPLCSKNERVVFSCSSRLKAISLCASGDLRGKEGRLIYRFGKSINSIELEYGSDVALQYSTFTYHDESWAKGAVHTVGFSRGGYHYIVEHAAGVYGVDGGPNYAKVMVLKSEKKIAEISCNEPKAIDHMYEELNELGLPDKKDL